MASTNTHTPSVESILNSPLWARREGARRAHMAAWLDFLWYRSAWLVDRSNADKYSAYRTAEAAYWRTMRITNHMDGYVWSTLAAKGVDVDQLPAGRDECPRCKNEIVENYGCPCTNVDMAVEHG